MPYDDINNFTETNFDLNNSDRVGDSSELFVSDGLFSSGIDGLNESTVLLQNRESSEYNTDYSDILWSIDTSCTLCTEQIESLSVQIDNLNSNVCILNDNLNFGLALLFTIVLLFFLKLIYNIFIKVLGLGQA